MIYEIPLNSAPQQFRIMLGGTGYTMTVLYRAADDSGWIVDFSDPDGNPLVCGIPLVTGADLLAQYAYLGFNGEIRVVSDGSPDAVPSFANLGSGSHVLWIGP